MRDSNFLVPNPIDQIFWVVVVILFIAWLLSGCGAVHVYNNMEGGTNVVVDGWQPARERQAWLHTIGLFDVDEKTAKLLSDVQPTTLHGSYAWLQEQWDARHSDANDVQHGKKVVGFFIRRPVPTVYYIGGNYGTLVHEYCHALNFYLAKKLAFEQDEWTCKMVERRYELELRDYMRKTEGRK